MKTCEIEGCDKPYRARGLCATHYNQRHQPNRHRKAETECSWCGRTCRKATDRSRSRRFCTYECRDALRAYESGIVSCPIVNRLPVLWVGTKTADPDPTSWRRWVSGQCARCGDWFVAEDYTNTARYCSRRCSKRINDDRYRARRRDAYREDVSPISVFNRDGWRCQICKRKVRRTAVPPHPMAPVLDHIEPLALGGTHEPSNVQCAHFLCNSKKTHRGFGDQLLLFA